jgi:UDP-N-acetylglucosamine--N-acetylmuramyl-(pentapeptide) pyrophosphoryl-undecaprenol N-acetylglucosamine transferase
VAFQFPVSLSFATPSKAVLVPLLPWKSLDTESIQPTEARKRYGLDPCLQTILVFGGSQGASFLNGAIPGALKHFKEPFQVIHFTGSEENNVGAMYARFGIAARVQAFEKEMSYAYRAADLAICRSGAGTVAELIRFSVPALLIPYPFATGDHQRKNGDFLASTVGGGRLLLQIEATEEKIAAELQALHREAALMKEQLHREDQKHRKRVHLAEMIRTLEAS